MTDQARTPDELRQLEAALADVRFGPRMSLGPEIAGRLRRGERSKGVAQPRFSRSSIPALAAGLVLVAAGGAWLAYRTEKVTVDHCCFDFDGGGAADDGVVIVSQRGEDVRRIAVYEDRDGSRSLTHADVIRFDRGARPAITGLPTARSVTTRQCCSDLDGGGPADDGLLLVTIPPDQVTLVALYERPAGTKAPQVPLR